MARALTKLLTKELKDLKTNPLKFVEDINCDNLRKWIVKIHGPEDTSYATGIFTLSITFGTSYPLKAPIVKFTTNVYHLNVNDKGGICIAIIIDDWTPKVSIRDVLKDIFDILQTPAPQDTLNEEALVTYVTDEKLYHATALAWTEKFAIEKVNDDDSKDDIVAASDDDTTGAAVAAVSAGAAVAASNDDEKADIKDTTEAVMNSAANGDTAVDTVDTTVDSASASG